MAFTKKKETSCKRKIKSSKMEEMSLAVHETIQFRREQLVKAMNEPFNSFIEGFKLEQLNNAQAVSRILELIMETPNYKRQVVLIDSILSSFPLLLHALLFHATVQMFPSIPTDRKDKFFYLLKRTLPTLSFEYVCGIPVPEVSVYVWSLVEDKTLFLDWDDRMFIEYVIREKPFILKNMKHIRIERKVIEKYLNIPMHPKNREMLYNMKAIQ